MLQLVQETMCVSLCVYLSNVAVLCVTKGDVTQTTTQTQSIRNKQNIHMPKKDLVWCNTSCSLAVTLYRVKRSREQKQQRY